jgi:hypothetical protein
MLKIVEYGLLAVSLLTIFGLILISPRSHPAEASEVPLPEEGEVSHNHAPLGAKKS